MAKITEVRLTLAAFIYGIEIDLKHILLTKVRPFYDDLAFLQNEELKNRILDRYEKENPDSEALQNIDDLIHYIDFQDVFTTINKNKVFLSEEQSNYFKSIYADLCEITPIRNRVMHTRPLLGGDFATVYGFVEKLKKTDPIKWNTLLEMRNTIQKDPTYVLTLKIPENTYTKKESIVIHNLPAPDFDETGFIGRVKDVDSVKQLIFSNKVVTILGDGGIGKTALALKVAYDIADMNEESPFELIIWTSAKTSMLTSKGIQEIYNTITDYTGLIDIISESFNEKDGETEDKLEKIIEYLGFFKTLLIIDNLETIQSEEVRDFIRRAQVKCNIVITSRIGLGELEYPRTLTGLSENESASLIRGIANIRNSETLIRLPQKTLVDISEKLYFNPLALKWFVSTVEMGIEPADVINNKDDLLNFCLTNVYDKLSSGAITILNTIRAARRKLTTGEIIYLSGLDPLEVRKYLIELFKTTLINREIHDANKIEELHYYISDFAKEFLTRKYKIEADYVKQITKKYSYLEQEIKKLDKVINYNEFDINALSISTPNQKVSAKFLSEALYHSKKKRFDEALKKVQEAKSIEPNYSEVYRVGAFIKATQGDLLAADEDYKLGLEIDEKNTRLLYYYSQFLLFKLNDTDKAIEYAKIVKSQRPDHPYTSLLLVRCLSSRRDYNEAIGILRELQQTNLDSRNKRIVNTELIAQYGKIGYSLLNVETDIENGIRHYKRSFEIFKECSADNSMDIKLIKNFTESLLGFISNIPATSVDENKEYTASLIESHKNEILLSYISDKIIGKYADKFNDSSFNELLIASDNENVFVGNVVNKDDKKHYAFIQTENNRYYANRGDFVGMGKWLDWKALKNGTLVKFELGTNKQGECAKKIIPV